MLLAGKLNHLGKFVSNKSMNTKILLSVVTSSLIATAVYAFDPPPVGSAAPEFSLSDAKGGTHSLSQYKGKYVVLEWFNPEGKIAYEGAIDSKASPNPADIPSSTNYVKVALDESLAGKPVTTPQTKPYGCSVKYK